MQTVLKMESFFSKIVDATIEWATVLDVLAVIPVIAIVVAILVVMLDYWLGAGGVEDDKQLTISLKLRRLLQSRGVSSAKAYQQIF